MNPAFAVDLPKPERRKSRRGQFIVWVRKTHGWFGLWGALLGLIFGTSGIWLNHRNVLKLPMDQQRQEMNIVLDDIPADPQTMTSWLQHRFDFKSQPIVKIEHMRRVPWFEKTQVSGIEPLMQPEHWTFNFNKPHMMFQADYWKGNRTVNIRKTSNGFIATLSNFHKGIGMTIPWILLVDTLAGSLIFLSISGTILWVQTHRRRRLGLLILMVSVLTGLAIIGSSLFRDML